MWQGNSSLNLLCSIYGKPVCLIISLFISYQSNQYGSDYAHSLDKCKLGQIRRREIIKKKKKKKRPERAA